MLRSLRALVAVSEGEYIEYCGRALPKKLVQASAEPLRVGFAARLTNEENVLVGTLLPMVVAVKIVPQAEASPATPPELLTQPT